MVSLRDDLLTGLCRRPCQGPPSLRVRRLMPDGSISVSGAAPRPLCAGCTRRGDSEFLHHLDVRFETEPGADIGDLMDNESTTVDGAGIAIINVRYDDPRGVPPEIEGRAGPPSGAIFDPNSYKQRLSEPL